jgi:putative transposase
VWTEEHARWQKRDLSAKRYVYCWADGIHLEARLEEQAQCRYAALPDHAVTNFWP